MLEFSFDGVEVKELGVYVRRSAHLKKPKKNIEVVEIQGRSDPLIIDDGSYSPLNFVVECLLDAREVNTNETMDELENLLQGSKGRKRLTFNDGKQFDAVLTADIEFTKVYHDVFEFNLTFNAVEVTT